jgi:N-acetylmuramoyl-L-alanine amidase
VTILRQTIAAATALVAVLAAASSARAESIAALTVGDVALAGVRAPAASTSRGDFTMIALQWRGAGSVMFRTRSLRGRWSAWRPAAPEAEDAPDVSSGEARRHRGWRLGNPWWVGAADRFEVRTRGRVAAVRAYTVWSPPVDVPSRSLAAAGAPSIVPRSGWRADESIRRAKPAYAAGIRFAVVHHTAGSNSYTRAEAAAIVRGIEIFHVQGNGWNDIGYNFLVDRFGTVYEGRFGGIDRNVVGAHAQGFNTGSVGVALIGTYGQSAPSPAAEQALERLLAWRLDLAHIDPLTTLNAVSGGNPRFPSGIPVFMRAVSGHRDTGFTECPGDALYARLNEIAARTQAIGLPKLYEPRVTGALGGKVRFRARLSAFLPWQVVVTDSVGAQVASGSGMGATVDWTWDATLASPGSYRWRLGGPGMTAATGTLGNSVAAPALAITALASDPETVSPNADGHADTATLTYELTAPATVAITVHDAVGSPVLEAQRPTRRAAGQHAVPLVPDALPDGSYTVNLVAQGDDGAQAQATISLTVTRTLGFGVAAPGVFSPNGDGRADRLAIRFRLAVPADIKVRVLRDGKWVATPFSGSLPAGPRGVAWDGSKRLGRLLDGSYTAVVEATESLGTSSLSLPFASDTRAPLVRFLPGRRVRVNVSEPATLVLRVAGIPRTLRVSAAGNVVLPARPGQRVRVVAWDAAGNASAPVRNL